MKKMTNCITAMLLVMAGIPAVVSALEAPENPATGIWIQQVGDIVPHGSSRATLYYTKYQNDGKGDRVKGISYTYNGAGYLLMKPSDKKVVCTYDDGIRGADGIVQHPDGDLLVAAQEQKAVYKVSKTAGSGTNQCRVKKATPVQSTNGIWHLMMDPSQKILWGSGIPGPLFRFATDDPSQNGLSSSGYKVSLIPNSSNRRKDDQLATIVWDGDHTAFFTYSDYLGGGCEINAETGARCSESTKKSRRAGAYFGYFTDTTYVTVTRDNQATYGGKVGDKVIKSFGTKILIDSLEGAHGATYDEYSRTIFVFGGAKIVQIQPYRENGEQKAKVVATIDLREYFFNETLDNLTLPRTYDGGYTGWRLDQGTVDGYGHLFVASNTGHMVFVDYAANSLRRIDDNVLIHIQWIDNFLDDVAPLKGVIVDRDDASTGSDDIVSSDSRSSSSLVEFHESSSSMSSSSNKNSSSSTGGKSSSSGSKLSSSSGTSSSSGGSGDKSSSSNGGKSSSSNGGKSSSSNGGDSSSSNGGKSSSSNGGTPGTSSSNGSSGTSSSGGGSGGKSSSSNGGSNSGSSSSRNIGSGEDIEDQSSSSRVYFGADDYEADSGSDFDSYPSADDFEKGDDIVSNVVILVPDTTGSPHSLVINGNNYLLTNKPTGTPMDLRYDVGLDSAKVGQIVAITLDSSKIKQYFGDADSLKFVSESEVKIVNPNGGAKEQTIVVNADGSATIFVTAEEAVKGASIKVFGGKEMIIIDNINFYDPIPDAQISYIKDTDGDKDLDYVEVLLKDPLPANYDADSVWLIFGKDTVLCTNLRFKSDSTRDRIIIDSGVKIPSEGFPKEAKAMVSYSEIATGSDKILATYYRSADLIEQSSFVIRDAFAIRDPNGLDSLFIKFNVDLIPKDISAPELLVMLKQDTLYGFNEGQIKKVFMPAKDIIILVGKNFGLKGDVKKDLVLDSVSLHPNVTFSSLPYITSDEYDREVPISVTERFPSAKNVEYWDTDNDGELDQIVTVFEKKVTAEDVNTSLYMTFPWYSSRGMLIQLQAKPADLIIDPKDSTRVIWNVQAATRLVSGVTKVDGLPEANIFTYYSMFCDASGKSCETFANEESAPLVDRMAPVVSSATLSYGSKSDTLLVVFSEAVLSKDGGLDCFSFIHGGETFELSPTRIDWASDGFSAKLILDGGIVTIMPGDSLIVRRSKTDAIMDNERNIAGENPQPVIIGGLLNHLVEATNMGTFDANDDRVVDESDGKTYTLQTVSSVNLRYVPGSTTKEDMEKEGALGQLVQLGERFVPQLLDRAQIAADGSYDPSVLDSLKPEDVYISFIVNYFDHLGQYVNDSIITVPCNSPKFGGNCLESDKKVFVNWNFKDHNGRFVGTGVYNVQFKMVVRYEDKKIEEEIKDKWGVRRKKGKHKK